jgi:hypothetical protein
MTEKSAPASAINVPPLLSYMGDDAATIPNKKQEGVMPNSELSRNTLTFSGSTKLNEKLKASIDFWRDSYFSLHYICSNRLHSFTPSQKTG